MPNVALVGAPAQQWDYEIFWPRPAYNDTLVNVLAPPTYRGLYKGGADAPTGGVLETPIFTLAGGAGNVVLDAANGVGGADGVPQFRLTPGGAGTRTYANLDGLRAIVETVPGGYPLPAGASMSTISRVWWLKFLLRWVPTLGNPTNGAGLIVCPSNAPGNAWPGNAVGGTNRGGFGIVGDGAGQWQYVSYSRTGIYALLDGAALPAHNLGDANQVEILIVSGRPGANPYVEFWFNGTLIRTATWAAAQLEPMGGNPVADAQEWYFGPMFSTDDQGQARLGQAHLRCGRYLRDGTEITGF